MKKIIVTVIVLTYNHENFIEECLRSVFKQKGEFEIDLYILNDASADNTGNIVDRICQPNDNINIHIINNEINQGYQKQLRYAFELAGSKADTNKYFTILEGDDYWIDDFRIKSHIDLLENTSDKYVMSVNGYVIFDAVKNQYDIEKKYQAWHKSEFNIEELITTFELCRSFSFAFYKSNALKHINESFFNHYINDGVFHMYLLSFGDCCVIKKPMTMYRIHGNNLYSSLDIEGQTQMSIDTYKSFNTISDYRYDYLLNQLINIRVKDKFYANLKKRWTAMKSNGHSVSEWLKQHQINSVAIYGCFWVGEDLLTELTADGIIVECFIDKSTEKNVNNFLVYHPKDMENLKCKDVIVAADLHYNEIKNEFADFNTIRFLSLGKIIDEISK